MKEVLIEGEDFNKQGRNVWIGRGGNSSAKNLLQLHDPCLNFLCMTIFDMDRHLFLPRL